MMCWRFRAWPWRIPFTIGVEADPADQEVWHISDHFCTVSGPFDGLNHRRGRLFRLEPVGGALGQKAHMPAAQDQPAHLAPIHIAAHRLGAGELHVDRGLGRGQLDQMHLDLAVHAEHEFVMRSGEPAGHALGAHRFDHIFEILGDSDALIRLRLGADLENVGEDVVLGIVVDESRPLPLSEVIQRPEFGLIRAHNPSSSAERTHRGFAGTDSGLGHPVLRGEKIGFWPPERPARPCTVSARNRRDDTFRTERSGDRRRGSFPRRGGISASYAPGG